MKKLCYQLFLLNFAITSFSQNNQFQKYVSPSNNFAIEGIVPAKPDGVILYGTRTAGNKSLVKLNGSNFSIDWQKDFSGTPKLLTKKLFHKGSGRFYGIGADTCLTDSTLTLSLFNNFQHVWTKYYPHAKSGDFPSITDANQLNDGSFVLTGNFSFLTSDSADYGNYPFAAKIDTLGNILWSKTYSITSNDDFTPKHVNTINNELIISGEHRNYGGLSLWTLPELGYFKLNLNDGSLIDNAIYFISSPQYEFTDQSCYVKSNTEITFHGNYFDIWGCMCDKSYLVNINTQSNSLSLAKAYSRYGSNSSYLSGNTLISTGALLDTLNSASLGFSAVSININNGHVNWLRQYDKYGDEGKLVYPASDNGPVLFGTRSITGGQTQVLLKVDLITGEACLFDTLINLSESNFSPSMISKSIAIETNTLFNSSQNYNYQPETTLNLAPPLITDYCANSVGINEISHNGKTVLLYPNPTSGKLFIDSDSDARFIKVFDSIGTKILDFGSNTYSTIDLDGIKSGFYYILFEINGTNYRSKILKE